MQLEENWEWAPAPVEASDENSGIHLDEEVLCPKCSSPLDRVLAGLWTCDECGSVWKVEELAEPPQDAR